MHTVWTTGQAAQWPTAGPVDKVEEPIGPGLSQPHVHAQADGGQQRGEHGGFEHREDFLVTDVRGERRESGAGRSASSGRRMT